MAKRGAVRDDVRVQLATRKREGNYKDKLVAECRVRLPHYVTIRHEDAWTSGIPDISLTGRGLTTWIEAKHGTPRFAGTGLQALMLRRLATAGRAWYLIWREDANGADKQTLIVHPENLKTLVAEASCSGYSSNFVIDFIEAQEKK